MTLTMDAQVWAKEQFGKCDLLAASFLKQSYVTACIGKWHLGWQWATKDGRPPRSGLDRPGFVMFVVPADRKLDSHAVRQAKGWQKLRFATREEVMEMTGLVPGSIPPFGNLFGLPTLCDRRLGKNEVINFNAGDHSISVSMRYADYVQVERPNLGTFAE